MSNKWIEINTEKTRKIMFKSDPNTYLTLTNVTHFKKRSHGCMLKCDEGVVYFETDDVSHIISECDDWVV
jgi:hypothetical protein